MFGDDARAWADTHGRLLAQRLEVAGETAFFYANDPQPLLDKLAHACLIDAARSCRATLRVFPHNHLGKLESLLQWAQTEHEGARVIICTESVFSMDGDRAPVRDLVALKKRYRALLLLDEAHAVGVIGKNGRGLAHECEVAREVDVLMGTMSKALGVSGGYLAGRHSLIDLLINRARSFVFSTAQPPAMAAAATMNSLEASPIA